MPPVTHPWNMQRGKTIPRQSTRMIARLQEKLNHAWLTAKDSIEAEKHPIAEAWTAFSGDARAKLLQHGVGRYAIYLPNGVIWELEHIPPYTGNLNGEACRHTPDYVIGFVVADVRIVSHKAELNDLMYLRDPGMHVLAVRHMHNYGRTVHERGFHATVLHKVYTCQHRTGDA